MDLQLNQSEQLLLATLLELPPNFKAARQCIQKKNLNSESVTKAAIRYTEECFCDVSDHYIDADWNVDLNKIDVLHGVTPGLHSTYIYDVVKFLLEFGLEPNAVFTTEDTQYNIMQSMVYIENEYQGIDALALLMDSGGDPNLMINGSTMFIDAAFDIWFGSVELETRWLYDIWVHRWMVLVACGGKDEGTWPKTFPQYDENGHYGKMFDISELKNHRNFTFGLSFEDGQRTLLVFDKRTFWKVAEWR